MSDMNRRNILLSSVALAAAMASPLTQATEQPIRLIVPYAPGGPLDVTSRAWPNACATAWAP